MRLPFAGICRVNTLFLFIQIFARPVAVRDLIIFLSLALLSCRIPDGFAYSCSEDFFFIQDFEMCYLILVLTVTRKPKQ